jgi:hypothetical protein
VLTQQEQPAPTAATLRHFKTRVVTLQDI